MRGTSLSKPMTSSGDCVIIPELNSQLEIVSSIERGFGREGSAKDTEPSLNAPNGPRLTRRSHAERCLSHSSSS